MNIWADVGSGTPLTILPRSGNKTTYRGKKHACLTQDPGFQSVREKHSHIHTHIPTHKHTAHTHKDTYNTRGREKQRFLFNLNALL